MTETRTELEEGRALLRRLAEAERAAEAAEARLALDLAALAEGGAGLDAETRAALAAALAADPDLEADLAAARSPAEAAVESGVDPAVIARAAALVPAPLAAPRPAAEILPFRRPVAAPATPAWRDRAQWAALAASIALAAWLGFALGNDTANVFGTASDRASLADDLFDPPSALLGAADGGSAT